MAAMGAVPLRLRAGARVLQLDRPLIMGVVNVTPDSFSAGHTVDPEVAVAHGVALWRAGADLLDIGGEASNPRARAVSDDEELARVLPVLRGLAAAVDAPLSIDTTKARVAERAVAAGASVVNDVSGGRFDAAMLGLAAELARDRGVAYVAGHLRGGSLAEVFAREPAPAAPPQQPTTSAGGDPLTAAAAQVLVELVAQVAAMPEVLRAQTVVDPGLGFGKGDGELNLELLRHGGQLAAATGRPVLLGPSRKRFLRRLLPTPLDDADLDAATVGACLAAVRGGAHVVRVHNVALLRPALTVYIKK
jgi:dihydropteroate synthase